MAVTHSNQFPQEPMAEHAIMTRTGGIQQPYSESKNATSDDGGKSQGQVTNSIKGKPESVQTPCFMATPNRTSTEWYNNNSMGGGLASLEQSQLEL